MRLLLAFTALIVTFIINSTLLFCQAELIDRIERTNIRPDSLYSVFIKPTLPDSVIERYLPEGADYQFRFLISIYGYEDKIKTIKVYPLYGFYCESEENPLWRLLEDKIIEVSKEWRLKPIEHLIKDSYPDDLKEYYESVNSDSSDYGRRPWGGVQSHIFIQNVYFHRFSGVDDGGFPYKPMLFYWMNIDGSE